MKIILSGGGTGGHIYPALAIASEIKRRIPEVDLLYVGTEQGLESKIVPQRGIPLKTLDITGVDRTSMRKAAKSLAKIPYSFFQARQIIKEFQPDVIVGTGGYVSYPIVLAGTFFCVRTVIHEQNAMPGLANKSLAKRVDKVLLTFEEAKKYLKAPDIIVTGLPVRTEVMTITREDALANLGLQKGKFTLLVFGGSLGAMSINRAMIALIDRLQKEDLQIIWITGQGNYETLRENIVKTVDVNNMRMVLQMHPYLYNMEEALAAADLAVCRAGASTLSELEVLGLPAILVPYPYASENHQAKNAQALLEKNAAEMVIDEQLDGDTLFHKINALRQDTHALHQMSLNMQREAKPNALRDIVDIILENH